MIPADRPHLRIAAVSDPGLSGKNNEDRYSVSAFRLSDPSISGDPAGTPSVLAVVADGIGGHRAGEVAAEIAVETISNAVAGSDGVQPVLTLQEAVIRAGRLIYDKAEAEMSQKGMGSTCAVAWVLGDRLYTVSVGDLRIYLIREGVIWQLTVDHTWVQEAIEQGVLSPDQARGHPNAHVIRRYLGSRQPVVPDLRLRTNEGDAHTENNQGLRLLPGDCILLCSDGLTDLVGDDEILAALHRDGPEKALRPLVNLANQRGGHDNVTVLTLLVPDQEMAQRAAVSGRPRLALTCAGLVIVLALLAVIVVGGYWLFRRVSEPGSSPQGTGVKLQATLTNALPGLSSSPLPSQAAPLPAITTPSALPSSAGHTQAAPAGPTLTPWPTHTRPPGP